MLKLNQTKKLVEYILTIDERTRNSDSYLYLQVLRFIALRSGINLNKIPVTEFLLNMNNYPFPPFESVRRARQKLQAEFPSLAACDTVQENRAEYEQIYHDFALEGKA